VGSISRLEKIVLNFDQDVELKRINSSRQFTTVTGMFMGVPVSVVAIGMVSLTLQMTPLLIV
jgi:uridine phosphorylase